ncbi:RNA polymerase II subunit A C-terminal domain phosphatase [Linnemannia hyalina]|uniref:protein-serine/threonine phosphatase n=1 Tax=Linnemannia hyalina TaxID=64524 RepID=A0A9P7XH04_9FUNG|nr:RNA polymerase II subunit A C-terminal domain phosphatase [Linnemannia hyalina]
MVNRNTLDFVLHMLHASVFHVSFPFFLIPLIKMYGFTNESSAFLMAAFYGVLLFVVKIALWLHERSQRRDGKVDWEDEVVLITGGASGIGYLLAEMLAIRHITVVVLDVHPVKTARKLSLPVLRLLDIESYICDVSDPEDIARVANEIREDVGEPTILINNAGIVSGRSIMDLSIEDIKRTINVNYLGQAFTIKEFLPDMIKNNHGHIAAVKAFHETLESEIKYVYKTLGVRTTLVCCGKIETGMFQGVKERMPFITPTLEPLEVVKEIIESMEQRRTHNQIMMPFYVNFVPLVSILPGWFQDLARTVSGADKAMDTFVGKKGVQPRSTLQVVDAFPVGGESKEDKKACEIPSAETASLNLWYTSSLEPSMVPSCSSSRAENLRLAQITTLDEAIGAIIRSKNGFTVSSYGTGTMVRLPGPTIDKPNIYNFGTPYNEVYQELKGKDTQLYQSNGLLLMLDRNRKIKNSPERWQESRQEFDVIITCEERCFDAVCEDLIQRGESHSNPVHVINVDIKDNYEEAMVGGRMILHLAKDIEQARDLDQEIQPILDRFNQRYPSAPVLHSVSYF